MKNKGTILTIVLILTIYLLAVVVVVGCMIGYLKNNEKEIKTEIKEDGFFKYIVKPDYEIVTEYKSLEIKNDEQVVVIVGFTTSGKQQEVIEVPKEIEGKPVRYIGYRDEDFWHNNNYIVHSENLRKIYVYDNIQGMVFFQGSQVDMMICSSHFNIIFSVDVQLNHIYVYKSLLETQNTSSDLISGNIVFMNNYSNQENEGYYRLDYIQSTEKIPIPPNPVRSGYEFTGWYTEPECINEWHFDLSPTIENNIEFRLFAGWKIKI